jgi:hypothetical protein
MISWFSADLRENGRLIEHKFACDRCGYTERLTVPFEPTPPSPKIA